MEALKVEGLSKNFGGVQALRDVSFKVEAGERLAIIGPNGAGKTTLFNMLDGQLPVQAGRIYLHGKDITNLPTHRRVHLGQSRSFQITSLFPTLTLLENCLLALQGTRPSKFQMFRLLTSYENRFNKAQNLLEMVDLWEKRDDPVSNISHGEQRRLEIAISLASEPRLLLLDEPSAGLTAGESAAIVDMIHNLGRDITVLMVAHDMDLVFGVAERIMVLHYGQIIVEGAPEEVKNDPRVKEIYVGIEESTENARGNGYYSNVSRGKRKKESQDDFIPCILEPVDIHTYYGDSYVLQGVSLEVKEGSTVALLGRNGMGKTTTINSIIGLTPPRRGTVRFKGKDVTRLPSYEIAQMGMGLVPQGRYIFPSLSVKENLTMSARRSRKNDPWSLDRIYSLFPVLKERANLKSNLLSGGEQQMLTIGRALMTNPDLVLMDEPSEGLAPLMVQEIGHTISQLKESGFSILLVEQNLLMALAVADYVYVISKGVIVYEATTEKFRNNHEAQAKHLGVA